MVIINKQTVISQLFNKVINKLSLNKGNNKITELRTILQRESQNHKYINRKISQQPENCENCNDPDLVQAFLKEWWVESDFKAPNLPLSLRLKVSGCHVYFK
jgi:sucrose-6-phosphate hydrolase SacC (GH32 family)